MTLIPKISRLKKLPELLKQKKNAEERSKREKDDPKDQRPAFEIEDDISISPETITDLKIHQPLTPHRKPRSVDDEKVGKNIDLTI
ncbi:MAG TPA: hypothetical protein VJ941_01080 [Gracilimonas sp.]|nr:hypothetical protein [Gracilimonas sp.]